jgi:protein O-mannosyl-transferase
MLSIITISCLGIIVYFNTFFSSFHLDDASSIVNNFAIKNIQNLPGIWNFWPSRFITYLSIAFNYHFNGLNVFGYHLFNLMVHLVSAILVWWLGGLYG